MALKENSKTIYNYLLAHDGEQHTAQDIANATGLEVRRVNGSITSFQKKGYTVRKEAEIELADGTHNKVKFIELTDEGRAFDPDAPEEKPAE